MLPIFVFSLIMFFTIGLKDLIQGSIFGFLTLTFLICLLIFYKLTIYIDDTYIIFKLGLGMVTKKYPIYDIKSCKAVRNSPLYGIGIRKIPNGWLYNVSGLDAIELTFKNKKSNGMNPRASSGLKERCKHRGIRPILRVRRSFTRRRIKLRTNGYAFGKTLKGNFTLTDRTRVKLFIKKGTPPYIHVKTEDLSVYINFRNHDSTLRLYEQIRTAWTNRKDCYLKSIFEGLHVIAIIACFIKKECHVFTYTL